MSLRLSSLFWLLPAGALFVGACAGEEANDDDGNACSDDSECPDNKVCEDGRCVWWQNGSGGSGSGSTSSSTGSGMVAPDANALCEEYLGCLAVASPESVPQALEAFGPEGSCWSGGADIEAACGEACAQGMKDYHYVDAAACPECHVDADCPNGVCGDGSCAYVVPLPDTSETCAACAETASSCADLASECASSPSCLETAQCFAACDGDLTCAEQCPDPYATGYVYYWACTMCEQCIDACDQKWCQLG